jgi:DNA helicase-2/ATP-dependent DNA helicase PcrA
MNSLEGLNPEQQAAVMHVNGPLLVVAGAGTGKTQVITRRIAHLISEGHARPSEILALTFTDKAAREMQERLFELIGWESYSVSVLTFNAFGSNFLMRFANHIGRSVAGGLLNDVQKTLLLQQHLGRIKLKYYGPQVDLYEYVVFLKESAEIHPYDIAEQEDLLVLYELYERLKIERGVIDYNDQLYLMLEILKERPNIATRVANEYRFVLVDEYQDTNPIQDDILRMIVKSDGNIFAVGDDDQAIYGFRGADISNILNFTEHYSVLKPVVLTQNYRSGQSILDLAYRLIQYNNPERLEAKLGLDKHLRAQSPSSIVEFVPYLKNSDEIGAVANCIINQIASGAAPSSIAVLSATHAPLKNLAKALRGADVPFALSTSANIFEQSELLHLWYLMRWINNSAPDEAIGHIILGTFIDWEIDDYRRLLDASRSDLITIEAALRISDEEHCIVLTHKLDEWRTWAQVESIGRLAYRLIFETQVGDRWQSAAKENSRMQQVFEDLSRLFNQMQDFEVVALDPKLASYMSFFPIPPTIESAEPIGEEAGIQLLTVHASKGLEFSTVYVIGCTQRAWSRSYRPGLQIPDSLRRLNDLPPEHEYRRLMYVAVTRAKEKLIVSSSTETANSTNQQVSSFIQEMFDTPTLKPVVTPKENKTVDSSLKKIQQYYPLRNAYSKPRLPFETSDGWLELSVGDIVSYEHCPYDFYLERVLGLRQPFGPQISFGVTLHSLFQAYYEAKLKGDVMTNEELLQRLDDLWTDNGYANKDIAIHEHQLARVTLANFIKREDTAKREIKGVELPIRMELPEAKLRLKGRIDVLFEIDGGIELRDYKTGRTKTDPDKLAKEAKESKQLRTYALAFKLMTGSSPARVTLDYVVTGVEGEAELSTRVLQNHQDYLLKIAKSIRARDFMPKLNTMHTCAALKYYGTGELDEE